MAAVEAIAEEVATNLEEVASATRSINATAVGYLAGGFVVGAALGFYFGYKYNKEKIKAEAYKTAEEEVEAVREIYRAKTVALDNENKPDPGELVQELGYSVRDDMGDPELRSMPAPTPQRPLPAPVPITNVFLSEHMDVKVEKDKNAGWNVARELETRTPDAPYVIHQDEYMQSDHGYTQVVYTYYDGDDVMVDAQDNQPITNGAEVVGADNLKWGHGSDDADVVFVRNDRLELDIQICRSPKSYEEEVLGLENDSST